MKKIDKADLFRVLIPVGIAVLGGMLALVGMWLSENLRLRDADPEEREIVLPAAAPAELRAGRELVELAEGQTPAEGVGRVPEAARYLGAAEAECPHTVWIACEFDDPLPWWWDPEGAIPVAEYHSAEVGKKVSDVARKDIGCPDWNYNSSIVGWNGRTMEIWEMDVFARIFYLEFWQPNMTLCEAGCDAMLRLWELNGGTMFETLSHINENGSYAFSTYPGMWSEKYDPDGIAWCRAYCEKRFSEGPVWAAQYFRKGQYHDWGEWTPIPAYEIDGIYFSIARWT